MACVRYIGFFVLALVAGCSRHHVLTQAAEADKPAADPRNFGVLVMAHGGSERWNDGVMDAVNPLQDDYPVEVAFGMADATSMQQAVSRLEAQGVEKIGVVRLFISGESWYERTEQILGLRAGAPQPPAAVTATSPAEGHHGHSMAFWKVKTGASYALSKQGLAEAEAMGAVLVDRARRNSRNPQQEVVLILAHGPADDAENARWIAHIDARAEAVRQALPFRRVQVMTLREDWAQKRAQAEQRIRQFVTDAAADGLTTIVIPFRVHGFGPYAQVLEGLDYVADEQGLIPHRQVTGWIAEQIASSLKPVSNTLARNGPALALRPRFLQRQKNNGPGERNRV